MKFIVYDDYQAETSASSLVSRLRKDFSAAAVSTADTKTFIEALKNADGATVAVIPGISSETSRYPALLGTPDAAQTLENFVESGGLLITICAGSYFVCRETIYQPAWGPAKGRVNPRPLFNATARGPLAGLGLRQESSDWFDGVRAVAVRYKDQNGKWMKTSIAYGNGPALFPEDNDPQREILARFEDVPGQPIAAAWQPRGKGALLWLGVLPYMGYDPRYDGITDAPKLDHLMKELKPHEQGRQTFWNSLTQRIRQHRPSP